MLGCLNDEAFAISMQLPSLYTYPCRQTCLGGQVEYHKEQMPTNSSRFQTKLLLLISLYSSSINTICISVVYKEIVIFASKNPGAKHHLNVPTRYENENRRYIVQCDLSRPKSIDLELHPLPMPLIPSCPSCLPFRILGSRVTII